MDYVASKAIGDLAAELVRTRAERDEARATIRAERVAPDREKLIAWLHARWELEYDKCHHGTYSGGAQNGKPYAMCERWADALLAAGVLGVNADTIRADAWDEGHAAGWADAARGKGYRPNPYPAMHDAKAAGA